MLSEAAEKSHQVGSWPTDFSGSQGSSGWRYGFTEATRKYDGAKDFEEFSRYGPFKKFNASRWFYEHNDWVSILPGGMHPGSNQRSRANPDHDGVERWAVLRWTSSIDQSIKIEGNCRRPSDGGDGIAMRIFRGKEMVWEKELPPGTSETFSFELNVAGGDYLDFISSPVGRGFGDHTGLRISILGDVPGGKVLKIPLLSQLDLRNYRDPGYGNLKDLDGARKPKTIKALACLAVCHLMIERWIGNTQSFVDFTGFNDPNDISGRGNLYPDPRVDWDLINGTPGAWGRKYVGPANEIPFDTAKIASEIEGRGLPTLLKATRNGLFHFVLATGIVRDANGNITTILANDPLPINSDPSRPPHVLEIQIEGNSSDPLYPYLTDYKFTHMRVLSFDPRESR